MCYHRDTGVGRVAIVKPKANFVDCEEVFFNEIDIMRNIDHPNVVKLQEVYEDPTYYYVVTELFTGRELLDGLTNSKTFTEQDAAIIMKQILSGIAYCHSKKIVHRDIKPRNIIFESREKSARIKIIDFVTSQFYDPEKKITTKIGTPYYVAPEVLKKKYNEKCDVWSCGVILYVLLVGYFPFNGKGVSELLQKIMKGTYTMKGSKWDAISEDAKDLIMNMLMYDPEKRFSAEQALSHKWIKTYGVEEADLNLAKNVLNDLRGFNAQYKLQQAALTFMVSQLATNSEKEQLRSVFISLDKDGTGKLSKEELMEGYKYIYTGVSIADEEIEKIMDKIDIDKTGFINYTEFAIATIDKKTLLSQERMEAAFKMFDKDGSGKISLQEIKEILTGNDDVPEDKWKEVIKEVNEGKTDGITLETFISMMKKLLS